MTVLIPVKKGLETSIDLIGHKGLLFSKLDESLKMPFSLIISSKVFKDYLSENGLTTLFLEKEKNISTSSEMLSFFQEATRLIMNGSFPTLAIEDLRECFELASIDTDNPSINKLAVLSLKRSTDYIDTDEIVPVTKYTRNEFDDFLRSLKTCFISLYSPSSINRRKELNVDDFSCAIIVSRIPNMDVCFESEYSYHTNNIKVQSYVGFIDPSKSISRDEFALSTEFLKITDSNIVTQDTVSIFDVTTNNISQQKFTIPGSSQSSTDQEILEIGRLTKKIASQSSVGANLKIDFIKDKSGSIVCLDILFKKLKSEKSGFDSSKTNSYSKRNGENNNFNESNLENKNNTTLDIDIINNFKNEETILFANSLMSFLKSNRHKTRLAPTIDIVLRSLENEVSKETLLQGIHILKELINDWD